MVLLVIRAQTMLKLYIVFVKAIRCTCISIIESINYIQIHAHQQAIYSCMILIDMNYHSLYIVLSI